MGVNHSVQGTETVTLLNTLACSPATSAGRARRRSRSPASATPWAPGRRASRRRCPATAPTTTPPPGPSWPRCWGVDEDRLPDRAGPGLPRHHQRASWPGAIKGLWIIGTNPVVSFPNREVLERALGQLDLLVVQDGFETPTTALADVVLPAAIWGEKDGTFTNSERRVSPGAGRGRRRRARPGPTSTSSSPSPSAGAARDELFAGLDGARATRSRSGGGCRPAGRATTAASPGSASTRPAACSGRAPPATRPCRSAAPPASTPTAASTAPAAGPPVRAVEPRADPRRAHGPSSRSCSTPAAPSSTGTPAPRPAGSPILERLAPEAWVEVHPADADRARRRAPATGCGSRRARGEVERHPGAGHADRAGRRGVHPVPLGRALRQPAHRRRVRPDQPGAELQAVRGARQQGVALTTP